MFPTTFVEQKRRMALASARGAVIKNIVRALHSKVKALPSQQESSLQQIYPGFTVKSIILRHFCDSHSD